MFWDWVGVHLILHVVPDALNLLFFAIIFPRDLSFKCPDFLPLLSLPSFDGPAQTCFPITFSWAQLWAFRSGFFHCVRGRVLPGSSPIMWDPMSQAYSSQVGWVISECRLLLPETSSHFYVLIHLFHKSLGFPAMQPLGFKCRTVHPAVTIPCVVGKAMDIVSAAIMPLLSTVLTYCLPLSFLRLVFISTSLALIPLTPRPCTSHCFRVMLTASFWHDFWG